MIIGFAMNNDYEQVDLEIALKKLHQLQLEDGDLGAAYWLSISKLLKDADQFRRRAMEAEERLREIEAVIQLSRSSAHT